MEILLSDLDKIADLKHEPQICEVQFVAFFHHTILPYKFYRIISTIPGRIFYHTFYRWKVT